jgi:hypothetical protein
MSLLHLLIAIPVAVLLHELAHGVMALATTRGKVLVVVGYGPAVSMSLGRLALRVSPLAASGCCVHRATRGSSDRALIAAAGPIASLLIAVLGWRTGQVIGDDHVFVAGFFTALGAASGVIALITALPVRYPAALAIGADASSDGLRVLRTFWARG